MDDISALSREDTDEPKTEGRQHRLASFIPGSSMEPNLDDLIEKHYCGIGKCKIRIPDWVNNIPSPIATFEPQSKYCCSTVCNSSIQAHAHLAPVLC